MAVDPLLGEIMMFAGNFAPRGWAFCNGRLLPISQNEALFSLLGTTYGGNGRTDFALPDLRGRAPIHEGQGPGLSSYRIGQRGGTETNTLNVNNLPQHSHTLLASNQLPNTHSPSEALLATETPAAQRGGEDIYRSSATPDTTMNANSIGNTGNGSSFSIRNPYLAVNFCIALEGIFPSRS